MNNVDVKHSIFILHNYLCFLGGQPTKKNPLTAHHIVPVRENGPTIVSNLAPLCRTQHDAFNIIERQDKKVAIFLNDSFKYIIATCDYEYIYDLKVELEKELHYLDYKIDGNRLIRRR